MADFVLAMLKRTDPRDTLVPYCVSNLTTFIGDKGILVFFSYVSLETRLYEYKIFDII